jgi:putative oxidoreductase
VDFDTNGLNIGLAALRVLVGLTLASHGVAKFRGGLGGVGNWFDAEGLRPGRMHATAAAVAETGGSTALTLGLLTPLVGLGIVANMTVAGFVGHRKNGFFIIRDGWEYTFVLATVAASLAGTGPGEWSLDDAMGVSWSGVGWFVAAAVGGVALGAAYLAAFYRPPAATA